jgi:hypothetical protein
VAPCLGFSDATERSDAMRGSEIVSELQNRKVADQRIIKWWRKENDFLDYELVGSFLNDVKPNQEFGGYEVIDTQEMWETLQKVPGVKVSRDKRRGEEVIVWTHTSSDGRETTHTCNFSPQSIMTIFDIETRGDVVDG